MRVLTHVCCGPCFTAVSEELKAACELTALYFNPNIHPGLEYRRRLLYLRSFCRDEEVPLLLEDYRPVSFFDAIHGVEERAHRCRICYRLRLARTAERAARDEYDAFTTTLLISPHQDHDAIVEEAGKAAKAHGVEFFYQDLRQCFGRSAELARERGMYRQKYCGCLFSEEERYAKKIAGASSKTLP